MDNGIGCAGGHPHRHSGGAKDGLCRGPARGRPRPVRGRRGGAASAPLSPVGVGGGVCCRRRPAAPGTPSRQWGLPTGPHGTPPPPARGGWGDPTRAHVTRAQPRQHPPRWRGAAPQRGSINRRERDDGGGGVGGPRRPSPAGREGGTLPADAALLAVGPRARVPPAPLEGTLTPSPTPPPVHRCWGGGTPPRPLVRARTSQRKRGSSWC